jgi:hypothetical protein
MIDLATAPGRLELVAALLRAPSPETRRIARELVERGGKPPPIDEPSLAGAAGEVVAALTDAERALIEHTRTLSESAPARKALELALAQRVALTLLERER